jgi:hypothetical protein
MPTLEENVPPVVKGTSYEDGDTIPVGPGGVTVYVVVEDPNGDEVNFDWFLQDYGYLGNATPIAEGDGSQVHIDWDEDLHMERLRCLIDDGATDTVTLEWYLEAL